MSQYFTPAIWVGLATLLLMGFSFWWLNLRRGRIIATQPSRLALSTNNGDRLVVEVPLIFRNTGAIPIVVQDLRLILRQSPDPLRFTATSETLGTLEERIYAKPFSVDSKNTVSIICEFQRTPGQTFDSRTYHFSVETKLDSEEKWRELTAFIFRAEQKQLHKINNLYVVYEIEQWQKPIA